MAFEDIITDTAPVSWHLPQWIQHFRSCFEMQDAWQIQWPIRYHFYNKMEQFGWWPHQSFSILAFRRAELYKASLLYNSSMNGPISMGVIIKPKRKPKNSNGFIKISIEIPGIHPIVKLQYCNSRKAHYDFIKH